ELHDLLQEIKNPPDQAILLRELALGQQKDGDYVEAMDTYLRLATLDGVEDELEPGELNNSEPDPNWSRARSRLIRTQYSELRASASAKAADLAAIDNALRKKLEEIMAGGDARALHRFLLAFGDDLTADRARQQLVERLNGRET